MPMRHAPVIVGGFEVSFDERLREEAISAERTLRRMTQAYKKLVWDYQTLREENYELRKQLKRLEQS